MIRKAVGAIIHNGKKFLLAQRVMIGAGGNSSENIEPEWDIIKGGMNNDETPKDTLLRELFEETGSTDFIIEKELKEPICFTFTEKIQKKTGWESQETTMFLVKYFGDKNFHPSEEIGKISFFKKDEAIEKIKYDETKDYFRKYAP